MSMEVVMGIIEVEGLVSLVGAIDAMSKSAGIEVLGFKQGPNSIAVFITGEYKPVAAVLEVGKRIVQRYGEQAKCKVIPNPHGHTQLVVQSLTKG